MTKRGRAIAENLAAGAKTSLLQRDDLTLTVLVKDAMKDSDVAYIIITDEKGQIRAHSVKCAIVCSAVNATYSSTHPCSPARSRRTRSTRVNRPASRSATATSFANS